MRFTSRRSVAAASLLALQASVAEAVTVSNTILVFARDAYGASVVTSGLQGYGIPFQTVLVPSSGVAIPALNSSATNGNYGGIIVHGEVAYQYTNGFLSAFTTAQWNQLYNYQTAFGVRMVRIDVFPTAEFGATTAISGAGCCATGVEQLISITNATGFPTANIKTGAGVSTTGLWHYPATITNATIATPIAAFEPSGQFTTSTVAAVINKIGARQQMVWFTGWATDWSASSNYLQHAYIHWMTRGLFVGRRKTYLSTQIDDMHLSTGLYQPNGTEFRVRVGDLDAHKAWVANINTRLPAGSQYFPEIGHNGNGDIEAATNNGAGSGGACNPDYAVYYDSPPDTALEFQKPLGTGTNLWTPEWTTYKWSLACAKRDPVATWFSVPANRDVFGHLSHTFTHLELNNATFYDADKEIKFNIAWMQQIGISAGNKYSAAGLIPPAITGLHNGDVIRAWMQNGIKYVVGDNTRPVLRNANKFWPLTTTVPANGYAGLVIIPRFATTIYYNCDLAQCTLNEWINTSGGSGDFNNLLKDAKNTNTRYLLGLMNDPYMFHQANMRQTDAPTITVGNQTGKMSLLQIWVETITQEMARLTNWPIRTLKHDDIAKLFMDRQTLDGCAPNLSYTYSANGQSITAVTVTANGNNCAVTVPVTVPGAITSTPSGATQDKVTTEPLIVNVKLSGQPVTINLNPAVPI